MANYSDVAKLAQVSPSTVSHVLNKTRFVSPQMTEKVLKAIKELDYRPNLLARGLAIGKTNTIGLIVSDIKNPFFPEVIQGVEELALNEGYYIFLCNTDYNIDKGIKSIRALIQKKVDGIILDSGLADNFFLMKELLETKIPIAIIDWNESNINADRIILDFKPGIKEAVEYLVCFGHRNIYFISGPKNLSTSIIRKNYFLESIEEHRELAINHKIFYGDFKFEGGVEISRNLLKENILPTAIMCANDLMALGVMKTLKEYNIKIPYDISIIGLDNIQMSELVEPSLTTLEYKKYLIGQTAMQMLINRIMDKDFPTQKKNFTAKLIKRNSTAKVKIS